MYRSYGFVSEDSRHYPLHHCSQLQDHRCLLPDGGVVVGGEVRVAPVQPVIQNSDPHPAPAQPAAPHRRHVQGDVGQAGPGPGVLQYRWCTMENAMRTFYELLTYLYKCYMVIVKRPGDTTDGPRVRHSRAVPCPGPGRASRPAPPPAPPPLARAPVGRQGWLGSTSSRLALLAPCSQFSKSCGFTHLLREIVMSSQPYRC